MCAATLYPTEGGAAKAREDLARMLVRMARQSRRLWALREGHRNGSDYEQENLEIKLVMRGLEANKRLHALAKVP